MLYKKLLIALLLVLFGVSNYASNNDELRDQVLSQFSKSIKFQFSDSRKNQGKFLSLIEYEVILEQDWNNGAWIDYKRTYNTTNLDAGNMEGISQTNANGVWVNTSKNIVNFSLDMSDSSFRFLSVYSYQWDANTSTWAQAGRSEYLYDANNFLIGVNGYLNMGPLEIHYVRITYTNNSAGMPLTEIEEKFDFQIQQFKNEKRLIYVYNPSNLKDCQTETEAFWTDTAWQDTLRTTYTRNSMLNPTLIIMGTLENGTVFQNTNRNQISYLANGEDVTEDVHSFWDMNSNTWTFNSRQVYTYTSFGKIDVYLFEVYSNGNYEPWLRTTNTYNSDNKLSIALDEAYSEGSYHYKQREIYTYEPLTNDDVFTVNEYSLEQNYPNPFNPATTIKFGLNAASNVKLSVYNIIGQEVAVLVNKELNAGVYSVDFNAASLTSGTYFYRLETGEITQTRKMLLIK